MKKNIFLYLSIFCFTIVNSQIDLNRCNVKQKQSFTVNNIQFTDSLFIQQSYTISTLYVSRNDGSGKITTINGSPLGIKYALVNDAQSYIAIVDYNNSFKIIDYPLNTIVKEIQINAATITSAVWYKDVLIFGLKNGIIQLHSIKDKSVRSYKIHEAAIVKLKTYNSNILSISHDNYLKEISINQEGKVINEVYLSKIPTALAINPTNNKIAIGTFEGDILILDSKKFNIEKEFKIHKNLITKIKFFDELRLITSSFDKKIKILNIESFNTKTLFSSKDYVMNFDFNTKKLIYSVRDGELVFLNLECNDNKGLLNLFSTFK
ncbi:WD40 repeat domain-containing protein [Lacinutrix sp. MedPE-SW]|uniref:WD40 repeat domain-containing protein n=1 Tax=Lacinutrix sp. MedPE-SW TaxID=1860087 RepID=UPI00091F5A79|nr:WD40 repeat domain-containing protein [Lacinutrix sp. MedPE-SW]OIQ23501.1 MAG: hypothetical protein BM549_02750 [Lacinutrix sp. MedPE-SW]